MRFATFTAAAVTSIGTGETVFTFGASPVAVYDPDGEVAVRDGTLAHTINLLSVGVFRLEAELYFQGSSTGAHSVWVGWNGSASFLSPGGVVVPYMVDTSDPLSAFAAGVAAMMCRVTSAPKTVYVPVGPIMAGARLCTLTVSKIAP